MKTLANDISLYRKGLLLSNVLSLLEMLWLLIVTVIFIWSDKVVLIDDIFSTFMTDILDRLLCAQ